MRVREEGAVAVVGGGIAGLTAAAQAASRGSSVLLFEPQGSHGGLVLNLGLLDDLPFPRPLSGAELATGLLERARSLGCRAVDARVVSLGPQGRGFVLEADDGQRYGARSVIVATGARLRRLGVPGEAELTGRGVSQCDWCDGGFFRDQPVAVVGGGDAALQAALHLARLCSEVTVVVRGSQPRARRHYLERAADEPRIRFLWDTRVTGIVGSDAVQALRLASDDPDVPATLDCRGVFVFAGVEPDAACVPAAVERDARRALCTDPGCQTSLPGLYAIGAVRSGHLGGVAAAIGEAAVAAAAASARAEQDA